VGGDFQSFLSLPPGPHAARLGLTASFLIAGVSAYRLLKGDRGEVAPATLKTAVYVAAILIPLQIMAGDAHGLNTLEHQPVKVAAMEGLWETQKDVPAVLFAIPDSETRSNRYEISVPHLASVYLTHTWDGEVKGFADFPTHPPMGPVFWAFRIMVGVGMLMLAVSWLSAWQLKRKGSVQTWLLRILAAMTFAGWVALVAGWYVTEIGRQPWLVTGVLTAAEAASTVPATMIAATLTMYLLLYAGLIIAYISVVFYLAREAANPGEAKEKTQNKGAAIKGATPDQPKAEGA
jgi:cytochrome d ubiquinol oxidase subunit I